MNKKQYCYNCDCLLKEGYEFDICNSCALTDKTKGDTKQQVNATKIKKRRRPIDE